MKRTRTPEQRERKNYLERMRYIPHPLPDLQPYRVANAKDYVATVRAATYCAHCGAQPIEWHHADHDKKPGQRVSHLAAVGSSIARIEAEIAKCAPLCRRCHMKEDGRALRLKKVSPFQMGVVLVPPKPCKVCGVLSKPTWKGMCRKCYEKQRKKR